MGIKSSFRQNLQSSYPGAFQAININIPSKLPFKTIAVDISCYIYMFMSSAQSKTNNGGTSSWLTVMDMFLCQLQSSPNGLVPIIVFEGSSDNPLKAAECKERQEKKKTLENKCAQIEKEANIGEFTEQKKEILKQMLAQKKFTEFKIIDGDENGFNEDMFEQNWNNDSFKRKMVADMNNYAKKMRSSNVKIVREDVEAVKKLCVKRHIKTCEAFGEGEHACAYLCKTGVVDAAMSEDSDLLALGCNIILYRGTDRSNSNKNGPGSLVMVEMNNLLKCANLSQDQFTTWAILCGTDYNKNIKGIGYKNAFDLAKSYPYTLKTDMSIWVSYIENVLCGKNRLEQIAALKNIQIDKIFSLFNCDYLKDWKYNIKESKEMTAEDFIFG